MIFTPAQLRSINVLPIDRRHFVLTVIRTDAYRISSYTLHAYGADALANMLMSLQSMGLSATVSEVV